jgi:hypothetical protein
MQRYISFFSRLAAALTIAIATLVLVGWQFDIPLFKGLLPHLVTMKPLTATSFLFCGVSLLLHILPPAQNRLAKWLARTFPLVAVGSGVLTLVEVIAKRNFALEEILFHRALLASGVLHPGRLSTATALGFIVLGVALLVYEPERISRVRPWQPLALAVVFFALVQFLGYLYGVSDLYRTFGQNPMAVHTAFLFLLMSLGMFAASSDRGWMQVFDQPAGRRRGRSQNLAGCHFPPSAAGLVAP